MEIKFKLVPEADSMPELAKKYNIPKTTLNDARNGGRLNWGKIGSIIFIVLDDAWEMFLKERNNETQEVPEINEEKALTDLFLMG